MGRALVQLFRKTMFGFLITGSAILVNAQATSDVPAWAVSKDVQKVSNKSLFEDTALRDSHIRAVVVSPSWNTSKGVNIIGRRSTDVGIGNVASTGIPDIAISKGVQRIRQKDLKPERKDNSFKKGEEITRND